MIEDYVKSHTEKEVVAFIAANLRRISTMMSDAVAKENMYMLSATAPAVQELEDFMNALDTKMNGKKSKVL